MNNLVRRHDLKRDEPQPVQEYQLQPEQPPARKVTVTYRKRKVIEHA